MLRLPFGMHAISLGFSAALWRFRGLVPVSTDSKTIYWHELPLYMIPKHTYIIIPTTLSQTSWKVTFAEVWGVRLW